MTTVKVFFYGLFMDSALLESKGIIAESCQPASLDGYALRIAQRATLEKADSKRVHGIVMSLDENDLHRLYSEPSVADYMPQRVVLKLNDGNEVAALCYILPMPVSGGRNREYASALAAAARRIGLPADYVGEIETWAN